MLINGNPEFETDLSFDVKGQLWRRNQKHIVLKFKISTRPEHKNSQEARNHLLKSKTDSENLVQINQFKIFILLPLI